MSDNVDKGIATAIIIGCHVLVAAGLAAVLFDLNNAQALFIGGPIGLVAYGISQARNGRSK